VRDTGCWVLSAGHWVLGAGCWVLGAGCWVPSKLAKNGPLLARVSTIALGDKKNLRPGSSGCPAGIEELSDETTPAGR
jgi:hypothetical protein